jgi:endoglucanase
MGLQASSPGGRAEKNALPTLRLTAHHLLALALIIALALITLGPKSIQTSQAAVVKVRTNQLGYLPGLAKRATLLSSSTTPLTWQLKDSGGGVTLSGSTTVFGQDAASGDYVHVIDFSAYNVGGYNMTLQVGTDVSHPFTIIDSTYNALAYSALSYFYQSRSGIAISASYVPASKWARAAGPADTAVACLSSLGCSYSLNVARGWYDAGDHGKYVVNGGIATWTLLNMYERARYYGSTAAYGDGKLKLPENANGVPDLLDEARWELEFLLSMQIPAGKTKAGMAHHKMHDDAWTGLPLRPDQDTQPRHLHAPTTAATLNLAAVGAQCARIWQTIDATFSARCLTAAETAWSAAQANPAVYADPNDGNGGGAYPDTNVKDDFYWAAAELFITTGKATYQSYLTSSTLYKAVPTTFSANEGSGQLTSMTWANTNALGTISLAIVPNNLPAADITTARNNLMAAADIYVAETARQGYGVPFKPGTGGYPWGSSSFVLNNAIVMGLAYDLSGKASYLSGVVAAMDYILGRNPMDKSYVSGYGANTLQNPHHRFWAFSLNSAYPPPPPGVVSGGPNSGLQDSVSASLSGCAPAKCYIDNINAYATNEVTINWNAPLAWVAFYLNEHSAASVPTPTPGAAATATATMTTAPTGPTATATRRPK